MFSLFKSIIKLNYSWLYFLFVLLFAVSWRIQSNNFISGFKIFLPCGFSTGD